MLAKIQLAQVTQSRFSTPAVSARVSRLCIAATVRCTTGSAAVPSPLSPLSGRVCRDVTPAARFLYPIQYNAILLKVTEA